MTPLSRPIARNVDEASIAVLSPFKSCSSPSVCQCHTGDAVETYFCTVALLGVLNIDDSLQPFAEKLKGLREEALLAGGQTTSSCLFETLFWWQGSVESKSTMRGAS